MFLCLGNSSTAEKLDSTPPSPPPAATKRTRNDSINVIESTPKRPRESSAEVERGVKIEPVGDDTEETLGNNQADSRLTVCLQCGFHVMGSHANVSYCSSEHMCDFDATLHPEGYLAAICAIANAMVTKGIIPSSQCKTSTPNTSMNQSSSNPNVSAIATAFQIPSNRLFDTSNVERALNDFFEKQQ